MTPRNLQGADRADEDGQADVVCAEKYTWTPIHGVCFVPSIWSRLSPVSGWM